MGVFISAAFLFTAVAIAAERPSLWNAPSVIAETLLGVLAWFGELASFCASVFRSMFRCPFEGAEFLRQFDSVGAKSLPLVALAGAATGAVLSMQTQNSLSRLGTKSMLPAVIIYSLIKETGPTITGLIVSGRVGAGIGAELGSMKVTEQIDAMEASAVDPHKFLAGTRILACILALPLLTLAADFCGIALGWIVTTLSDPMSLRFFLNTGLSGATFDDFLPSTLKTTVFGFIIGAVSSFQGMRTHGGTEGVGRSATSAVLLSSLFIILADVILVRLIIVFFP
jgi:phospholipid/cholesterol/gamma-HCH transport system permease protein